MPTKTPALFRRENSPYYWGQVMVNGKRYRKALHQNKQVALQMYAQWKADLKDTSNGIAPTWKNFKEKYSEWSKANRNALTIKWNNLSIRYLEEFNPKIKKLSDVTPMLLDGLKTYVKNKNTMADTSINRILQSIKAIMRQAEKWDMIPSQKWENVAKYKVPKGRVEFFTVEELKQLLSETNKMAADNGGYSPWQTITLLGSRAGLRRSEITNLKWSDVNFKKHILSVTVKPDWHPKDYECRDIPLSSDLEDHLKTVPHKGEYVIYDNYGERYSVGGITTYYKRIVKRAGLTGNIHKLRHTFASHLVQNEVSLYKVKELLGHSTIKTTEIYAHLAPTDLRTSINKLPPI